MRYFKHDNLNINELMTFEDREYLNLVFYFIVENIVGLQGSDESINIWLERTKASEVSKQVVDAILTDFEAKMNEIIAAEEGAQPVVAQ